MTQNEFSVCKAAEWGDAVASSIDDNAVEWNSGKSLCEIWMIQHTSIQYGTKKPRKYAVCNRGWENRTPTKSFGDSYHTIWPIPYILLIYLQNHIQSTTFLSFSLPSILLSPLGYALDRLVTVSSIHYCTSTSVLSTSSSSRGLTTCVGISHLEGGFTLRCLQRLSRPGLATLPCIW